jgi:hypothetical protein
MTRIGLTALAISVALAGATGQGAAQPQPNRSGPQGDSWQSIAQLPDFSGIWDGVGVDDGPPPPGAGPAVLTAAGELAREEYRAAVERGDIITGTTANCLPPTPPRIMSQPYPFEFLFTPGKVTIAIETYSQMRRVFTDGRLHPEDPDPTFMGHSIGWWEDDTLVIDTIGFVESATATNGVPGAAMRVVERVSLIEPDLLQIVSEVHEPELLAQPIVTVQRYQRQPDWDLMEYICVQNNRDGVDEDGNPTMRLEGE